MENISSKVIAIVIALIVGSAFLPLLTYWNLVDSDIESVNSLLAILPVLVIIGLGFALWKKKK